MAAEIRPIRPLFALIPRHARIFMGSMGPIAVLLLAIGMAFCTHASAQSTTTISGTVYAPNGVDPLVNVLVYVSTASVTTPVAGANCPGVSCQTATNAIPSGVTLYTYSAVNGSFTLSNIPVSTAYTLVIQAGKWQRQFLDVEVGTTALTGLELAMPTVHGTINTGSITSSLPAAQTSGSVTTVNTIPLIAISTGSQDAMECVLRDVGIADTEFTDDTAATATTGGRIHLYQGDESAGAYITTSTPNEAALMGGTSTTPLSSYDMAMFPCQGKTTAESAADIENLIAYTSAGGRVFATHDSLVWLNTSTSVPSGTYAGNTFSGAVNWLSTAGSNPANGEATINTGFTDGNTLAQWMFGVGASTTSGQVALSTLRDNISSVVAPTQRWVTLNSPSDIMQITFNTPVGADAADQFGRVLFNEYHVEDGSEHAAFPGECGPVLAPSAMSAQEKMLEYSLFDLSGFVTAVVPPSASISITTDPANGNFNEGDTADTITANVANTSSTVALPANTTFTATLPAGVTATAMTDSTGGWSCTVGTLTCTRSTTLAASTSDSVTVTVSVSSTATGGAATTSGTVNAQVASPNFSSNVTSPITITLVQAAAVSWATPAAITYGTALSGTQLDAVGNAPSGTYVYTPTAGTVLSAGQQALSVAYTPGSTYTSTYPGTGTASITLVVNPAAATVTLTGLTQSYTGSPVAVSSTTDPASLPVTYMYTGISPTIYGPSSTPPTAAGSYTVVATIASGQNYAGTANGTLVISAALDTTSTAVQISPTPVMTGQPVTIIATVADLTSPATIPTGTVTFTDTTTGAVLNSGNAVSLNSGGAVLTGAVLSGGGTHTITAAYSGVNDFIAASSNTAQVQVGLSSAIGATISSYPVTVTLTTAGTPANVSVLTQGAPNLDFTDAGTGDTCISRPPSLGGTCTVNVNFAPKYAGPRYGAVVITDDSGDVLGMAYLEGTGSGPQMAFGPGTQIALPNSAAGVAFGNVDSVRTDASRNVYIADFSNYRIVKVPWTGSSYGTPIAVPLTGQSYNYANGAVVDGAGNLLVISYSELVELPWNGSGYGTPVELLGGLNPGGVAVDGAGNVYVSDYAAGTVTEVPRTASGYGSATVLFSGLSSPQGLAIDGAGNIYIANERASTLLEIPWTGSGYGAQVTVSNALSFPRDVAVDAAGDVYIADTGNSRTVVVPRTASGFGTQTVVPMGNTSPVSIALDELGNIFGSNGNRVVEADVSDPPSLSFASTVSGATSSDSPKTVTVTNDGNAPLTFTQMSYSTDFPEASGDPSACSTSAQLTAGTTCALPINFYPTATTGVLSERLALTDNNLNATTTPGTQQSILLSGTALATVVATQAVASAVLTQNHAAVAFTAVIGSGGDAPLAYSVSPSLPAGLVLNTSTGAIIGKPTVASAVTSYTVTVTDANNATATAMFSLTVDGALTAATSVATTTLTASHASASFIPVSGSGGTAPLAYSISPTLPAGLSFNASTGAISGTPTAASAATTYTVNVTDADNATATATFSLAVDSAVTAATSVASTTLTFYQGAASFIPVSESGGIAPLVYSISSALSPGLIFSTTTGAITGTPTAVSAATNYTVTIADANNATATAVFSLAVAQQLSQTVVSASPVMATSVQAVTLNATVAATVAGTPVPPSGTVTFFDNGTQLGAAANVMNGMATLVVPNLPSGASAVITAVYSGDGNFLTSTSANSATVVVGTLDFTFTNTGATAYTAAPGKVATYSFALAPLNGSYAGPVSFTVTGLPAGAAASFSPSSVAVDGGAVPIQMTVQTVTTTARNKNGSSPFDRGVVLALLLLPFGVKRSVREKLRGRMLLLVLLLAGMTAAVSGCASNNGFMQQSPGTYTLTVTASSGSLQHSQIVTLIVQ